MGRQRTINDASFWRSTLIAGKTQEDKATLLYLLTSPFSNIVGVYPIVPRIAAAEMGWTSDQLLLVIERLADFDLIAYDEDSCQVWVKIWWDHNSAKMAVGPSLRANTYAQIDKIIPPWRDAYVFDFVSRLPAKDGLRATIRAQLEEGISTVPTPCLQAVDRGPANTTNNPNSIDNTNSEVVTSARNAEACPAALEFPNLSDTELDALRPIVLALPRAIQQDVLDEIEGKRRIGRLKIGAAALCSYFQKNVGAFVLSDGLAIQRERAHRLASLAREAAFAAAIDRNLLSMNDADLQRRNAALPPRVAEKAAARRRLLKSQPLAEPTS